MSKSKLRFLGYALNRHQHGAIVSLIEMTGGRFGIHKKSLKNEADFWSVISGLTGFAPSEGEGFVDAAVRISAKVRGHGLAWRDTQMAHVEAKDLHAMLTHKSPLSTPVTLYPTKTKTAKAPSGTPTTATKDEFYRSWDWRTIRMATLIKHGQRCQCCGATPDATDMTGKPVRLCVDHIKPISKFWHLRLEPSNLQILCDECNQGKGNWDQTDFRKPAAPDEWVVDDVGVSDAILAQLTDRTTGRLQ
jgi:5-methylcytosine-specific restriction endonuclease McrA